MPSRDANARASGPVRDPASRGYVATVTSLLELTALNGRGLTEMTMTAYVHAVEQQTCAFSSRAETYARAHSFDRPTLVMDVDAVAARYRTLATGLGRAAIFYAVKANPAEPILACLAAEGARFDAASRGEIALCLGLGVRPEDISFGNTIKKAEDIAFAHRAGVRLFAADATEELAKLAEHAPGSEVFIRVAVDETGAEWPLSRKFGVPGSQVLRLLSEAAARGLKPVGLSFHVGSQTRRAAMWADVLDDIAAVWDAARAAGFALDLLNIGGGFPAFYGQPIDRAETYAAAVMEMIDTRFEGAHRVMAEPGRGLVAEAGVIAAEVVLATRKAPTDLHRWVFLDIGKFSGLAETIDEAIRYQIASRHDGGPTGPCIVAGPTCDSADVLYERRPMDLPLALSAGDKVIIRAAGAYTTTYASIGFNGFPPLDEVYL